LLTIKVGVKEQKSDGIIIHTKLEIVCNTKPKGLRPKNCLGQRLGGGARAWGYGDSYDDIEIDCNVMMIYLYVIMYLI
jgi:hypothetical protein